MFLFLLLCAVAGYGLALGAGFVSDDFMLREAVGLRGPFFSWAHYAPLGANFLRPLASLSFYLDQRLWGGHAAGYHLTGILLHALNATLVFYLACRLLPARPNGRPAVRGALLGALAFVWQIGRAHV